MTGVSMAPTPMEPDPLASGVRPLHAPPSSRDTIELASPGRPPVVLLYVEIDRRVYAVPQNPPGAWFSTAAREGRVTLGTSDSPDRAAAVRSDPDLLRSVRRAFDSKYGTDVWERYFGDAGAVLEIYLERPPLPRSRIDRIRGEFDARAGTYEASIASNPVERYLKDRVRDLALPILADCDPILELGPGTGYHTLPLLAAGHRVLAIDVAPRMVETVCARASDAGLGGRLVASVAPSEAYEIALDRIPDRALGGAFSAFGALELEPDPSAIVRSLARTLRPGGRLVITSLNRPGWSAVLWELAMARPSAAGLRLRQMIPAGRIRYPLEVYPRSPDDWTALVQPAFELLSVDAVSVLAPPFDSHRGLAILGPAGLEKARRWDERMRERRSFHAVAEWLLLNFRRVTPPSVGTPPTSARSRRRAVR